MTAGEVESHGREATEVRAEFREGAVRIVTETGKSVPEVVKDLGINGTTLASWVSRARRTGSAPAGTSDELERLRLRLRRENAQLKRDNKELAMEREVLKRCMVLWVK
ncbi:transposase [Streptomyces pratens]|uniref:Transposase n=1 Tax=Streptomyces pratens TaxID=887456 RepID=A0ABW1MBJ3_9ACTN